jgi:predicted TPR repeat methyltransferase
MKATIITEFPIASQSLDHIHPRGTMLDNTHHMPFVGRVEEVFQRKISHADLGCSGGGLVKDFLERGHFSVGVEGSDFSLKIKRAEWATIPDNLFTADITKPFSFVSSDGSPIRFDIISAWEVMEHIRKGDELEGLFKNIKNNLTEKGLFVASIANFAGDEATWHVTLENEEWWKEQLKNAGFKLLSNIFRQEHYVRTSSFYITVENAI